MEVTPARMAEIREEVARLADRAQVTRKDIERIIGKLQFVAACVRPGRIFINRLLNTLRSLKPGEKKNMDMQTRKDLLWWQRFLPHYNGVSLMWMEQHMKPNEILATDACLVGAGAIVWGHGYYRLKFPPEWQGKNIAYLEMMAIIISLKLWAPMLAGKRICIQCDNLSCCHVLTNGKSKDLFLQAAMREVVYLLATHQVELKVVHILTSQNSVADWLSRWPLGGEVRRKFQDFARGGRLHRYRPPLSLLKFEHNWWLLLVTGLVAMLQDLDDRLAKSTAQGWAKGSGKGLKTHIQKYVEFCKLYKLYLFNCDGLQIRRYLEHLTETHSSIDSMKNYISGVRTLLELMGYKPPPWTDYLYRLTVRGITREKGHVVKQAAPLTPFILVEISKLLNPKDVRQLVAWNVTLLGFYTFLRKMNLMPDTKTSFDARVQLSRGNFSEIPKNPGKGFRITVYSTKTMMFGSQTLDIPVLRNPDIRICPVFWYELMVNRVRANAEESAFTVPAETGNEPLTYPQWTEIFRGWLTKLDLDACAYSSHSMRRGGATWAAACNLSSTAIKTLGGWKSPAFHRYIDMSMDTKFDAMCTFIMKM